MGGVAEGDFVPPPAIDLEHSSRRHSSDDRPVAGRRRVGVMQAVKASANVGESEHADESRIDPVTFNSSQGRVLGSYFGAVEEFESSDLQHMPLVARQAVQPHIELFGEDHGRVPGSAVWSEIACAESELSLLRTRAYRIGRKAEQERYGKFCVPIPAAPVLRKAKRQKVAGVSVT